MNDTTFKNANGLTAEGHLSTAYDMNVLGRHLFYDFPQYYNIFSRRTADAGIATVSNTNTRFLDAYEGADGIKTGYTSPAGFNLTASARRGNKHIIATVFGGTSTANRNAKMAELMDMGFKKSKNRVREQPPVAPDADAALVASAEPQIDEIDEEGGAGKTIRVSGEVRVSPRPKARPTVADVPAEVAIAMAEGINGALAEATTEPAPAGTLEFQAEAMAAGEPATETLAAPEATAVAALPEPDTDPAVALAMAALATEPAAASEAPEDVALATAEPAPLPPGSLEAQAAALAVAPLPEETVLAAADPDVLPPGSLEAQAAALAEASPAAEVPADPALAAIKPVARPTTLAATAPLVVADAAAAAEPAAEIATEIALAEPAPELVVTDTGLDTEAPQMGEVTDVETVSAAAIAPAFVAAPAALAAPARKAPIFDTVEVAAATPEQVEEAQEVVVMSTSGGRHFGVMVGEYPSRYEAERALLKTALAESATLNESLRKPTQADGAWRASFMGLTEDQAELACRRLRARAVPCETVGG